MAVYPGTNLVTSMFALITGDTPHLALFTTNPGPGGTGTEVTGGTYARQPITFSSIVDNSISNTAAIEFDGMPAVTAPYFAIYDAVSGGNLLAYGPVADPIVAVADDTVQFNIGDLELNFNGS
jgi:hypothetical protein